MGRLYTGCTPFPDNDSQRPYWEDKIKRPRLQKESSATAPDRKSSQGGSSPLNELLNYNFVNYSATDLELSYKDPTNPKRKRSTIVTQHSSPMAIKQDVSKEIYTPTSITLE